MDNSITKNFTGTKPDTQTSFEHRKQLRVYTHWRFKIKRASASASAMVLIVDDFFLSDNPQHDTVSIMDLKDYQPGEERTFTKVNAYEFYKHIKAGKIVEVKIF